LHYLSLVVGSRGVLESWGLLSRRSTRWQWVPSTFASFDTLAVDSLRFRVFRHVGGGFCRPSRCSTCWRWVLSDFASFDTLAVGCLRLQGIRFLGPPCFSTHERRPRAQSLGCPLAWVPCTSVSFNTSVLGSIHFRVVQHVGAGFHAPSYRSTNRRWVACAPASFDRR